MAEISYPFAAASAGGGSPLVSQLQWQAMSHLWAADRIDFQLVNSSYSTTELPFYPQLVGSDISIGAGAAWVGGFYYKNDAPWVVPAPTNSGAQPRIDLVVIRADMSAGSVNLAIKTGQAAANPLEPTVQRTPGGVWEMPICMIRCEANNGARSIGDRRRFDVPGLVSTPWNMKDVMGAMPPGSFGLDLDVNINDTQSESFVGRDGYMVTRHLGKRRPYTPDVFPVSGKPASSNRKGFWRYIAPGTVFFSVEISNPSTKAATLSGGGTGIGFSLPIAKSKDTAGVFHGFLYNPEYRDGLPNFVDIVAQDSWANTNCYLYYPNPNTTKEGLDTLKLIPGKSKLTVSGVYETNAFD